MIKTPRMLSHSANLLRLLLAEMAAHQQFSQPATPLVRCEVRVALAAYMCSMHALSSFENMGLLEMRVQQSAKKMLEMLHKIVQQLAEGAPITHLSIDVWTFPVVLSTYIADFKEWKTPDLNMIQRRIIAALVALHKALSTTPEEDPSSHAEIQRQIQRMMDKLQQLSGAAGMQQLQVALQNSPPAIHTVGFKMSKEHLAWELSIDGEFRFNDDGTPNSKDADRQTLIIDPDMVQGFWDDMQRDIDLGSFAGVFLALKDIQKGIKEVAGAGFDAVQEETEDLTATTQFQLTGFLRNWDNCIALLSSAASLVMRLQMQHRDADSRAKWQELLAALQQAEVNHNKAEAFCNALRFSVQGIHLSRIDNSNKRLESVAAVVREHGTEFLQQKFAGRRAEGLTIEITTKWLTAEIDKLWVREFRQLHAGDGNVLRQMHFKALVELIMSFSRSTPALPEVFGFDGTRLKNYSDQIEELIICGTVMRVICNSTEDEKPAPPRDPCSNIDAMLEDKLDNPSEQQTQFQFISCCVQGLTLKQPADVEKIIALVKGSSLKYTEEGMQALCVALGQIFDPGFIEHKAV
jgi:hypothetical protein